MTDLPPMDIIVKDITALNISDNEPFATVSAFTRQTDPIIVSYAEYHIVFIYITRLFSSKQGYLQKCSFSREFIILF